MDTDALFQHARARFEHAAARRVLKEKYQAKMIFAHAGGMWQAGPDLQCLLCSCDTEQAVLLDLYETPIRINVGELLDLSRQRWQEQMTAWLIEHEEVSRLR